MTKPKRVILTGGPGAEKTSILDVLAEDGFRIGQDVVREIIRERLAAGLSPRPSPEAFNQESFKRNLVSDREATETLDTVENYILARRSILSEGEPVLLHGDFRPANILVADGQITRIID